MNLDKSSINWAIKHLITMSDSDLFPRPIEIDIIAELGDFAASAIQEIDISQHKPGPSRRFVVPKDDLSYRVATQLDPLDSILLSAIIFQFGHLVEQKRRPVNEHTIFSYRFKPDHEGHFWDSTCSWNAFWTKCYSNSKEYSYSVILDIADFYNQISHHTIENQLIESGFPNQIVKWIIRLLETITAKVSRGIPVGPHAAHLLAEASVLPVDNSLATRGIKFCRFIDDIIIFTNSPEESRIVILEMANILDKQQRLVLQRQKTKIMGRTKFQVYCEKMVEDRPINDIESHILEIIKKYSDNDPYRTIFLSQVSDEDLKFFNTESLEKILCDYLKSKEPDFIRLRWFIRRLSQIGHPSAINFCVNKFESLIPALSEICHYFISVGNYPSKEWLGIGTRLLDLLNNEIIRSNEYFQMSIISLFNQKTDLDHINKLIKIFGNSSPNIRREIILASYVNNAADWIRELKEQYSTFDLWNKRAFLTSCKILPYEERKFFVNSVKKDDLFSDLLAKWVKEK
jgi:retron-type reverse transcriptase